MWINCSWNWSQGHCCRWQPHFYRNCNKKAPLFTRYSKNFFLLLLTSKTAKPQHRAKSFANDVKKVGWLALMRMLGLYTQFPDCLLRIYTYLFLILFTRNVFFYCLLNSARIQKYSHLLALLTFLMRLISIKTYF